MKVTSEQSSAVTSVQKILLAVSRLAERGHQMQFTRTGGCIVNERNGSKIPTQLKNRVHTHEGAAAETAAHQADEEDEAAMEGASAVQAPLPIQPTARELEAHRVAHPPYRAWCEACVRRRRRNADREQLAAEQFQVIDIVPVDHALCGEHDQN